MIKRTKLILWVNEQAGSDKFYAKSQYLGKLAADAFKDNQEQHRSQMTGLENIAETTQKVTDVLDYIKKQTAHQKGDKGWKKKVNTGETQKLFGELLKEVVESELILFLDDPSANFMIGTNKESKQQRQDAYLELVRQLIRQIVVQYEYLVSL